MAHRVALLNTRVVAARLTPGKGVGGVPAPLRHGAHARARRRKWGTLCFNFVALGS